MGGWDHTWNQQAYAHNPWLAISLSLAGDSERGLPCMVQPSGNRRLSKWLSTRRDFHKTQGFCFKYWLWFMHLFTWLPPPLSVPHLLVHWHAYCRCWLHKTQGPRTWIPFLGHDWAKEVGREVSGDTEAAWLTEIMVTRLHLFRVR